MADVRSLLRQQRAARRIEHPYAAYSDAGKLLCTLCHEHVKTESLWTGHVQTDAHKTRLIKSRAAAANSQQQQEQQQRSQKRKHEEEDEGDAAAVDGSGDVDMDDSMRRKRSKPDMTLSLSSAVVDGEADKDQTLTPPRLTRRTSTTPSQGVEMQIPSRPATPAHRDGSSSSTPGGPHGSLAGQPTPRRPSNLAIDDRPTAVPRGISSSGGSGSGSGSGAAHVDEAEWAAFEADIAAASVPYDKDATISAPAMTTEEVAQAEAAKEEEAEKRRAQADVDLEDEKEEATRALEDEFEEMEELEARVRRLKEKREALRKRGESVGQEAAPPKPAQGDKENLTTPMEEDEDEEDEEDEDDWDGFRFRTR